MERKYLWKESKRWGRLVAIADENGLVSKHNEFGFRIDPFKRFSSQEEALGALEEQGWKQFWPEAVGSAVRGGLR